MKPVFAFLAALIFCGPLYARSIDALFPGLSGEIKKSAGSDEGYYNTLGEEPESGFALTLRPIPSVEKEIAAPIIEKKTTNIIEMLALIPLPKNKKPDRLTIYNALNRISDLAGREYFSHSRQKETPLFKTSERIESPVKTKRLPDPPPQTVMPESENIYLLVDDVNFGLCYYLSRFFHTKNGVFYTLSNFKTITYLFFSVVKENNLCINFYFEIVDEGLLIYAVLGVRMEKIAASSVDIPSASRKRLDVLKEWLIDGIMVQLMP